MNITAIILTKNEEDNISDCVRSVYFCDEIIIIDDYSGDKTVEIAKDLGAKIYKRRLNNDFATQRNFALKKAKGNWVLYIDADERVTPQLKDEIMQIINNSLIEYSGFYITRKDFLWGKQLKAAEFGSIKLLRLAKRGAGRWERSVHEYFDVSGKKERLANYLLHYPHPSTKHFLENVNNFSTLHALANDKEGKKVSLLKIIIWPIAKFIYNWILRLGFRDKTEGFIVAAIMSFHSFLAWSKLWFLQKKGFTKL